MDANDEYLADAIYRATQEEDWEARNLAVAILYDKYHQALLRFATGQLRGNSDIAQEVLQTVWFQFAQRAGKEKEEKVQSVRSLLYTITRRRCIDERNKRDWTEVSIEDYDNLFSDENVEDYAIDKDMERIISQPWVVDTFFSDYQQILLTLRQSEYPSRIVGRLLGKTDHSVDELMRKARIKRAEAAKHIDDFYFCQEEKLWGNDWVAHWCSTRLPTVNTLELFPTPITPQLTPEELKPLGLTPDALRTNFITSLILPYKRPVIDPSFTTEHIYLSMTVFANLKGGLRRFW